jgi:hypothetical protein
MVRIEVVFMAVCFIGTKCDGRGRQSSMITNGSRVPSSPITLEVSQANIHFEMAKPLRIRIQSLVLKL